MDSDYCLICDRKTLGGIYCSQSCRLLDLANNTTHQHDVQQQKHPSDEALTHNAMPGSASNNTTPSASPRFMPTQSTHLPSLPILNSLDRYLNRASSFSVPSEPARRKSSTSSTSAAMPSTENTSIWRRRSILFYSI